MTSILITEDEMIVALNIKQRLQNMGYHVTGIASTGKNALEQAKINQIDLVLMDIRLKGDMDGIETARILRQKHNIPVVFLSAYADKDTLARARKAEPFGFLVKPFEERELRSTIETALQKIDTERELKANLKQLGSILEAVPDAIILLDRKNEIIVANDLGLQYTRLLTDRENADNLTHLGLHQIEEVLENISDGSYHSIELKGITPRMFEIRGTVIPDDSDSINSERLSWVLVIRDVSKEYARQEQIELKNRMAALGQFAAGMAHDFNNILTSLILNAQLIELKDKNISSDSRHKLQLIQQQSNRGSDLIRQLLDFSRSVDFEMLPLNLTTVANETFEMLKHLLPDNIESQLRYSTDDLVVDGNSTHIQQTILNIALNARDAMPVGGELTIELGKVLQKQNSISKDENNSWICIRISDTGTGIPDHILPHIFDPFYTTKPTNKGTGLGLAQVYGIINQHNGYVEVETDLETGTTFLIYLPAIEAGEKLEVEAPNRIDVIETQDKRILIVDDDNSIRETLQEILEMCNYQVNTAINGVEALKLLENKGETIDLILSDLDMPYMGGLEMCHHLRSDGLNVPIILLSGYIPEEVTNELQALSIAKCLTKPIQLEKLLITIADIFSSDL